MAGSKIRIAAVLTCHNRRDLTVACLQALAAQALPDNVQVDVILVDDGSTDGTAEAVQAAYPGADVIRGDGSLFWNGGMRMAFGEAQQRGYDFYLWLNDDTLLYPGTVARLLETHASLSASGHERAIVIGSVQDPQDGHLTYGGLVRGSAWHPLKYTLVEPQDHPVQCELMHGNCVLIPHVVAASVGNLDPAFSHAIGDLDYAMRARLDGGTVWIMPGYAGTCSTNNPVGSWLDADVTLSDRFKKVRGPKGLPPAEWSHYARKYAGTFWPLYVGLPYLRILVSSVTRRTPGA